MPTSELSAVTDRTIVVAFLMKHDGISSEGVCVATDTLSAQNCRLTPFQLFIQLPTNELRVLSPFDETGVATAVASLIYQRVVSNSTPRSALSWTLILPEL